MSRTKGFILLLSGLVFLTFSPAVFSQKVYTPPKNSKTEKEIISALKAKIDADGVKKAVINPAFFKVKSNWAYLRGLPKVNATEEEYYYNVKALLKKSGDKWEVIKYLVGSDDFADMNWWKEFNAPKAIFP